MIDDTTCKNYGLTYGSQDYAKCRQDIAYQRGVNARAMLGAIMSMPPPPQAVYHPMPPE